MLVLVVFVLFFTAVLRMEKAFLLAFFCQAIFFQYGLTFDVGSYAMLIVFFRIILGANSVYLRRMLGLIHIKIFLFLYISVLFWSLSLGDSALYTIITYFRVGVTVFTFSYLFESKSIHVRKLLLVALFALVTNLINAYLISTYSHPFIAPLFEGGRLSARGITGIKVNANTYSYMILVLFSIFALSLFNPSIYVKMPTWLKKTIVVGLSGFTLAVLGVMGSRTAIISMLVVTIILGFNMRSFIRLSVFLIVGFLFINLTDFSSFEVPFVGELANERIASIEDQELGGGSMNSRSSLIEDGIKIFLDYPFLGVGTGNVIDYMSMDIYHGEKHIPHNYFVTSLIEYGILGSVFIFYFFLKYLFFLSWRNITVGIIALMLFFAANMSHDYTQVSSFWIALGFFEFLTKNKLQP